MISREETVITSHNFQEIFLARFQHEIDRIEKEILNQSG